MTTQVGIINLHEKCPTVLKYNLGGTVSTLNKILVYASCCINSHWYTNKFTMHVFDKSQRSQNVIWICDLNAAVHIYVTQFMPTENICNGYAHYLARLAVIKNLVLVCNTVSTKCHPLLSEHLLQWQRRKPEWTYYERLNCLIAMRCSEAARVDFIAQTSGTQLQHLTPHDVFEPDVPVSISNICYSMTCATC